LKEGSLGEARAGTEIGRLSPPLHVPILDVIHCFMDAAMLKKISKVGNSQGLVFDTALRELTGLNVGDLVNVTVHEGGTIVITPMRPVVDAEEARARGKKLIKRNSALFKRLA